MQPHDKSNAYSEQLNACEGKLFVIIVAVAMVNWLSSLNQPVIACASNSKLFNYIDGVVDQPHDANTS